MANVGNPIRVVAAKDGYEESALGVALSYVKAINDKQPESCEVVLLTHTKHQLDHTSLSTMLGANAAKALRNNQKVRLPFGGDLRHETMRTMRRFGRRTIIIAFYGEREMLDFVDGIPGLVGVVVVPDLEGSALDWIERWNPKIHGEERGETAPLIEDPVVLNALKTLTMLVNLSTGISHPRDKEQANEIVRILRAKGHQLDPQKIKSWAIRNGWDPRGADDLARIVDKVASSKSKPSLSKYYDPEARYARWKTGE